ncbi:MAG: hypothetical protein ACXABD_19495, partial [Candidatus Thorarchaeota archaeon]
RYAKHDAIEVENVPPTVQIIDPTHPLFGNTYPVVNLATPHGRNWLSVEMPCGSLRIIPHEATNLKHNALAIEALQQLPRISPLLMVRLQQWLQKRMQNKEYQDEGIDSKTGGNVPGNPNAVASIDPTPTGADSCDCAADPAPVATASPTPGDGK